MENKSIYAGLGVDACKEEVREAFRDCIENDFPNAFVNILNDPTLEGHVYTMHNDGDGSKFLQRLLVFLETDDVTVIRGAVDDAFQMNLGDIAASGFTHGLITVTDVLNMRTAGTPFVKADILEQISIRIAELMQLYREHVFSMHFLGGETADLPDQVANVVFDVSVHARAPKEHIITGNVQDGDAIYGFASDGQVVWEKVPNSGIAANGLTLARTCTMWAGYNDKYPFLCGKNRYAGRYKVGDEADVDLGMSVSDALMSPTRQWSILIRMLTEKLRGLDLFDQLHGISMNTGGGATKIGHVGQSIIYNKHTMPTPPPIFTLIQREGNVPWEEMYRVFNCGVGIDVVGANTDEFHAVLMDVSVEANVALYRIGTCEQTSGANRVVLINTPFGVFDKY